MADRADWPETRAAWRWIRESWRELLAYRREQRISAAILKAMDLAEDYPATVLTLGSAMNVLEVEISMKVDASNPIEKHPADSSPNAAAGASCAPPAPSPSSPAARPFAAEAL